MILEILAVLIVLYVPTAEMVAESKLVASLNGRTLCVDTCQEYGVLGYNRCQNYRSALRKTSVLILTTAIT